MIEDLSKICNELFRRAEEIPFDKSAYQIVTFIEAEAGTPERAYRSLLLNLDERIQSLQHCYYNLKREDVELRKQERSLAAEKDDLERELIEIKIEETHLNRVRLKKLVNDALKDVALYQERIALYPEFTREQFENAEKSYFKQKADKVISASREAGSMGAHGALGEIAMQKQLSLSEGYLNALPENLKVLKNG